MVSQYQRKTINAYISSHYQEMFHVWNVPLDQNHYSLDNLIVSYTYHQVFDLKMSDEQRANAIIALIKERAGIRQYIQSCYHEEEEYFSLLIYQMYFRRLIRDTFNCINIMDEQVENIFSTRDKRVQSNLLGIERKMKVTDFQAYQSFMALINNYVMQKYNV